MDVAIIFDFVIERHSGGVLQVVHSKPDLLSHSRGKRGCGVNSSSLILAETKEPTLLIQVGGYDKMYCLCK